MGTLRGKGMFEGRRKSQSRQRREPVKYRDLADAGQAAAGPDQLAAGAYST
jgi:hypothetical protein